MLDKQVCPNCGELYDTGLEKCPLCGTAAQVIEVETPVQRKRITEAERKQRRDDRKEAELEARRRKKDEQMILDAEEERLLEEQAERRKEEKRRAKEEKKAARRTRSGRDEEAAGKTEAPVPAPTPVVTPAPARTKQRPEIQEKAVLRDRTRVPRFYLVFSMILLVAALAVGGSYLLWKLDVMKIPVYDRLLEKKIAAETAETVPESTVQATAETTEAPETTLPQAGQVPCTSLTLESQELTITQKGDMVQIAAAALPVDTTDDIVFATSDAKIAKVSPVGLVTSVAPGEVIITVTCGSQKAECKVVCDFTEESEDANLHLDVDQLILLKDDMTFFNEGENYVLSVTNIPAGTPVTWSSLDESIATVDERGHVVAVGNGTTKVIATVGDLSAECWVRCHFEEN